MKSKRRSREFEGPSSWREHRAMISHHDRRAARDRQVCCRNNARADSVTNFYHHNLNPQTDRAVCLSNVFSYCGSNFSADPARETWLWGPSFSHWGLLPREPASQSHLHYTVRVSTQESKAFHCLPMLTAAAAFADTASTSGTSPKSSTRPSRPEGKAQRETGRDRQVL